MMYNRITSDRRPKFTPAIINYDSINIYIYTRSNIILQNTQNKKYKMKNSEEQNKELNNNILIFSLSAKCTFSDEKPIYKIIFFYNNQICFEELDSKNKKKIQEKVTVNINQKLKYQVLWRDAIVKNKNDFGVKLLLNNNSQSISILLNKQEDKIKVRSYLSSRINHFGFHQFFKTTEKIGQGSFAAVYSTKRIQDSTVFAVKAISKKQLKQQQAIRLQIKILRKISHENIVSLKQVCETDNSIYLLFQQLQGPSLQSKLHDDPKFFSMNVIKKMMEQIFSCLKYLSQRQIFHRDIKLQNLKYKDIACTKLMLIDFGLADFTNQHKYLFTKCGTPGYVAPQILLLKQGDKIDPVCDVFSAGVIMYIMITKKHLFQGKTDNQVLLKNRTCSVDKLLSQIKYQTAPTVAFLRRCLQKNPQQRIKSEQALNHYYFGIRKASQNTISDLSTQFDEIYSKKSLTNSNQKFKADQNNRYKILSKFIQNSTPVHKSNDGDIRSKFVSKINANFNISKQIKPIGLLQRLKSNPTLIQNIVNQTEEIKLSCWKNVDNKKKLQN